MKAKKPNRAAMVMGDLAFASQSWLSLGAADRTKAFKTLKAFERRAIADAANDVAERVAKR